MSSKEFIECRDVVDELNDDLDEMFEYEVVEPFYLKMWYESYEYGIEFLGVIIWSTANDDREFIEDKNDYEPLKPFLQRKITNLIQSLTKIKFDDNKQS